MSLTSRTEQGATLPMLRMLQPDAEPDVSAVPCRLLQEAQAHQLLVMRFSTMCTLIPPVLGYMRHFGPKLLASLLILNVCHIVRRTTQWQGAAGRHGSSARTCVSASDTMTVTNSATPAAAP